MGIANTQKVVHEAKPGQTMQDALTSNQATYKPCTIFSAGECELLETFKDGRMAIKVNIQQRFQLGEAVQTLPFSIHNCEAYNDEDLNDAQIAELAEIKEKLLVRLTTITHGVEEAQKVLQSAQWQNMPPLEFSFKIFSLIQMPGDMLQAALENRSPLKRLANILNALNAETFR